MFNGKVILEIEIFKYLKQNGDVQESDFLKFLNLKFKIKRTKGWFLTQLLKRPFLTIPSSNVQIVMPMITDVYTPNNLIHKKLISLHDVWKEKDEADVRDIFDHHVYPTTLEC
ncbi:MAG: hypothetical protein ACFFG0_06020 [Candidatus Thorarchaeota archaeon]